MCHGTKAWLKAYHTDPLADLNAQFLPAHAGTIRGAVAIELDSTAEAWTSVSVLPHGQNGQLPNLDLVNLAVKAVQSERIQVVFDREPSLFGSSILTVKTHLENLLSCVGGSTGQDVLASTIFQRYWPRLQTLLQFMYTLVKGPNGVHGDFISYVDFLLFVTYLPYDINLNVSIFGPYIYQYILYLPYLHTCLPSYCGSHMYIYMVSICISLTYDIHLNVFILWITYIYIYG